MGINQSVIFDAIVHIIVYLLLATAIWLVIRPFINAAFQNIKHRQRLRSKSVDQTSRGFSTPFLHHIDFLIRSTTKAEKQKNYVSDVIVFRFLFISFTLFIGAAIAMYTLRMNLWLAIVVGFLTGILPYSFRRIRLEIKRSSNSYDLVKAVELFLLKYRSASKGTYNALKNTVDDLSAGNMKETFSTLYFSVQGYRHQRDLEEAAQLFAFTTGTDWAKQFAMILMVAINEQEDIEPSLSLLVEDMNEGTEINEENKRDNADAIHLGKYIPIIVFPLGLLFIQRFSTQNKMLFYQFETKGGLTVFIIALIISIIAFITSLILSKPRNEV